MSTQPDLAGLAVTARAPRFQFEQLCHRPDGRGPRGYVVAERSVVSNPAGQWQLQAQVLHWRGGDLARRPAGTGDRRRGRRRAAGLPATNPGASGSLIVDQPDRMAAVVSGPVILHQYLLADPVNSTVTELALWSDAPPQTPGRRSPTPRSSTLGAPLCTAYVDSCP